MSQSERRATPRFEPKSGAHILYREGTGEIKDLSLNGMFVVDQDPLPEGTKFSFALRIAPIDIQLQGIVIRSEPKEGMVIQFADITPEARRRLRIYIGGLIPATGERTKP